MTNDKESAKKIRSMPFQKFDGAVKHLIQHTQLLDIALKKSKRNIDKSKATIAEGLGSTLEAHPQLLHPCTTKEIKNVFNHSSYKIHEHFIIEMYKYFSDYMKTIIKEFSHSKSNDFLKSFNGTLPESLKTKIIIELGSYEKILNKIAEYVYRSLENERSTIKLVEKIISALKFSQTIDKSRQDKALKHLEIRHLIIHNNGRADERFALNKPDNIKLKQNNKISFDQNLSKSCEESILSFIQTLDELLVDGEYVRKSCLVSSPARTIPIQ